jgi:ketosteroid isomerase-like protein
MRIAQALISLLAVATACTSAPKVDVQAEETAIRALDEQLGTLVAKRDTAGIVAMYTADAVVMPANAPAARDAAAIRAVWAGLLSLPGVSLQLTPEKVEISAAGDLAADAGSALMEMDTPQGRIKDVSKFLVVWRKVNGSWKMAYDIWNENAPPAPPPADADAKAKP